MIFDGLPVAVNSSIHGVLNCESRTLRQMIAVYSAMERRYGNQLSIRYPDEANSGYDLAQKTLKEFPDSNRLISKLGLTDKPERKAPEVRSLYILDPVAQSVYDATCKMIDGLIEDGGLDSTASEFIIKTGMKCLGDFLIGQYQSTLSARQIDKLDSTIVTRGEFIAFFEPKQTEANAQA
jgi:hypothetical protein